MAEPRRKKTIRGSISAPQQAPQHIAPNSEARRSEAPFPIVGIGASAGGLEALQQIFAAMPADCGIAFIVIQHLDPTHRSLMDDLLQKCTTMPVRQAEDGRQVAPNHVYLIPPNASLTLVQGALKVEPPEAPRGHRAPIDRFFQSLAQDQGDNAICMILSGTGSDGTLGLKAVKEHGGMAMVQQDAKYTGMPHSAIETGLVDVVLPALDMSAWMMTYVHQGASLRTRGNLASDFEAIPRLDEVFDLLRTTMGHDFSQYKPNTINLRVQRRMQILSCDIISQYVEHLRQDTDEIHALFNELLIGVTHFFRDPEAFEVLAADVLPTICAAKKPQDIVRIWVPGCATGEEAYSIAILLKEHLNFVQMPLKIQIFATDIDAQALEFARAGVYPRSIAANVSSDRLNAFFTHEGDHYKVGKTLREMCIFSEHSLLKDPPFSRMDLISCRNVLIYLIAELQRKILPLFHYALRSNGFLLLGPSEGLAATHDLFELVDRKYKVFRPKDVPPRPPTGFPELPVGVYRRVQDRERMTSPPAESHLAKLADRLIQEYHTPAYVMVDDQYNLIYASARTGRFLELPPGEPKTNLLTMAYPELRLPLRATAHKALEQHRVMVHDTVTMHLDGQAQRIRLVVRPVLDTAVDAILLLILFEELGPVDIESSKRSSSDIGSSSDPMIQQLENELRASEANLQITIEELETSNEEMTSSNEELMSMNEELQSANEELEASKEELQSINEELSTLNTELQQKIEALARANNDIKNLLDSTHIATIFLDHDLRITTFTPAISNMFHVIETDVGRPITDLAWQLQYDNLLHDIDQVLKTRQTLEQPLRMPDGKWYVMRIFPYQTGHHVVDGVVMTFVDVTAIKEADEEIRRLNQALSQRVIELETLLDLLPIGIGICEDVSCDRMRLNRMGCELLGVRPDMTVAVDDVGQADKSHILYWDDKVLRADNLPLFRAARMGEVVREEEFVLVKDDGRTINLLVSAAPLMLGQGGATGAVMAFVDITLRKQMQLDAESFARQQFNVVQLGMHALGDADASAVMNEAVMIVQETLEVEFCGIFERVPDEASLRLRAGRGWPAAWIGRAMIDAECGSLVDFTLHRAEPVVVGDFSQDMRFHAAPLLLEQGVVSGVNVVIHNHGQPYGMLGAYTTQPRQFTANECFFLHTIAHVLTMALHRRRIEEERRREQLQRAERLASIGTLAAGIAHEMNNPLNTVMLSADHALSLIPSEGSQSQNEVASALHDILQETERCGTIIRNILRFTRHETTHKNPQQLNDIVGRFVQLGPQYLSRPSFPLTYIPGDNLPLVMLNATEIEHVLANLVENALNMADDVQVTVRTEYDGVHVRLLVQDNGPGIRQEDIPYIFDPFYSTRRQRGGMGLGLSIVHAIVTDHQGTIHVVSKPDQSTTFVLVFPPLNESAQAYD